MNLHGETVLPGPEFLVGMGTLRRGRQTSAMGHKLTRLELESLCAVEISLEADIEFSCVKSTGAFF